MWNCEVCCITQISHYLLLHSPTVITVGYAWSLPSVLPAFTLSSSSWFSWSYWLWTSWLLKKKNCFAKHFLHCVVQLGCVVCTSYLIFTWHIFRHDFCLLILIHIHSTRLLSVFNGHGMEVECGLRPGLSSSTLVQAVSYETDRCLIQLECAFLTYTCKIFETSFVSFVSFSYCFSPSVIVLIITPREFVKDNLECGQAMKPNLLFICCAKISKLIAKFILDMSCLK